jgi:single-stranded DNA-binding protein
MGLPIITINGNLSKLETKYTPSGKEVTKFQVECSEKNAKGEWENLYIKGEVWEQASQFLNKYFKNGSAATVTGKLVTNVYEKNDGSKVYENKLLFPNISFIPKDKEDNQGQTQRKEPPIEYQSDIPEIDIDETSIPF